MAEITLVRHGQANSGASDEASYDRLSDVGHQQARWLGEHMRTNGVTFDHVVRGDMRRHRETAEGIGVEATIDARWDELSYFALSDALKTVTGTPHPEPGAGFVAHVDQVFEHWQRDALPGVPETYGAFETRVLAALHDVAAKGGRSLVVTSTGVISFVMKHVLHLNHAGHMKVLVATRNTSLHHVAHIHGGYHVAEYGAVPHLAHPDRRAYVTHY